MKYGYINRTKKQYSLCKNVKDVNRQNRDRTYKSARKPLEDSPKGAVLELNVKKSVQQRCGKHYLRQLNQRYKAKRSRAYLLKLKVT